MKLKLQLTPLDVGYLIGVFREVQLLGTTLASTLTNQGARVFNVN